MAITIDAKQKHIRFSSLNSLNDTFANFAKSILPKVKNIENSKKELFWGKSFQEIRCFINQKEI